MSQELPDGVELPELPNWGELWSCITKWSESPPGPGAGEIADRINEVVRDYARSAILADREKQAARVPEGYALVPVEPTGDMLRAGRLWDNLNEGFRRDRGHAEQSYAAMLAAAPTEPSKPEQAEAPSNDEIFEKARDAGMFGFEDRFSKPLLRFARSLLATTPPASAAGERGALASELLRLADIMRDCGRLVSTSGNGEKVLRDSAAALASKPLPEQVAQDGETKP